MGHLMKKKIKLLTKIIIDEEQCSFITLPKKFNRYCLTNEWKDESLNMSENLMQNKQT